MELSSLTPGVEDRDQACSSQGLKRTRGDGGKDIQAVAPKSQDISIPQA